MENSELKHTYNARVKLAGLLGVLGIITMIVGLAIPGAIGSIVGLIVTIKNRKLADKNVVYFGLITNIMPFIILSGIIILYLHYIQIF